MKCLRQAGPYIFRVLETKEQYQLSDSTHLVNKLETIEKHKRRHKYHVLEMIQ